MSRKCGCSKDEGGQSCRCSSATPSKKVMRNVTKPLSGIPLGGIGTGSVELRADGRFHEWQIFNNPPWSGGSLLVDWKGEEFLESDDFYFAIRVKSPDSEPKVRLLASKEKNEVNRLYAIPFLKNVDDIEYIGEFPFVKINYRTDLPVDLRLDAFSPFIPTDIKNSSLPAAILTFTLKNTSKQKLEISMLGGVVNPVGRDVRKSEAINSLTQANGSITVEMSAKNIPQDHCQYQGSLALTCLTIDQQRVSYRASQPVVVELEGSGQSGEDYWRIFQTEGELDNEEKIQPSFAVTAILGLPDMFQTMSKIGSAYIAFPKDVQQIIESSLVVNVPEFEEAIASDLVLQADPKKRWLFILEQRLKQNPQAEKQYEEIVSQKPEVAKDLREKQRVLERILPAPKMPISAPKPKGPHGLLCSKLTLPPNAEAKVTFILTWFFPNHTSPDGSERMGHMYENWFSSALQVSEYVVRNLEQLNKRSKAFHDALYESSFNYWLVDAVNAQLTTFVKSSFYVKNGRFGIWEGIGCCGLQTLDVTYYGSYPILLFFPELQKSQMKLTAEFQLTPESRRYHEYFVAFPKNKKLFQEYAKLDPSLLTNKEKRIKVYRDIVAETGQDATGRIPHMFPGTFNAVDAYHMIDLMPKFTLLVLRDYMWTGDKDSLEEMWPHVKAAMDHNLSLDEHGVFLPYHYDRSLTDTYIASQTYDIWDFLGYSAYVSSIWLAALQSTKEIARIMGDEIYAARMDEVYEKAQSNMEKLLWNGEYYNLWNDPPSGKMNYYCMADQLNGQWFANFLKLGDILDKNHIKSALEAIFKYNYDPEVGLLNGALPEKFKGKGADTSGGYGGFVNPSLQRDNPWTGTEYAVASLLIQEGFIDEGLTVVKNVYDRYQQAGLTWNHIECGGHYYRAMDIWAVLTDLAGFDYSAPQRSISFKPKVNRENFKSVFAVPTAWGTVTQNQDEEGPKQVDTLGIDEGAFTIARLILGTSIEKPQVKVQKGSNIISLKESKFEDGSLLIEFKEQINVKAGETLRVEITSMQ